MKPIECDCKECTQCCEKIPGMFLPGEVSKAAAYMKLTPQKFFKKYCNVDYYSGLPDNFDNYYSDIRIIIPARRNSEILPGEIVNFSWRWDRGACIFYNERNRCDIHEVKPFECMYTTGCTKVKPPKEAYFNSIAKHWASHMGVKEIQEVTRQVEYDLSEEVKQFYTLYVKESQE